MDKSVIKKDAYNSTLRFIVASDNPNIGYNEEKTELVIKFNKTSIYNK